ncbi:hypothetical protein ARMGADRAFT_284669 [Armillaria gallica]|uniref:Uncharacterized protein n=1 Tax=Armillaria gallica TaxID=47427 RepID=A0A2H3DRT7_ARMGA|nr:hypothetical protein ARMGADRAFT_284669 [Armillaria gallica]
MRRRIGLRLFPGTVIVFPRQAAQNAARRCVARTRTQSKDHDCWWQKPQRRHSACHDPRMALGGQRIKAWSHSTKRKLHRVFLPSISATPNLAEYALKGRA